MSKYFMSKFLISSLVVILALSSVCCASTIQISNPYVYKSEVLEVNDNRSEESKKEKRESIYSVISIMAENRINPRPLDVFVSELAFRLEPMQKIKIDVNEFLIMDYFPIRARQAGAYQGGWLRAAFQDTFINPVRDQDRNYVENFEIPSNSDSVICVFSGKINDKEILSVNSSPYQISIFTALVKNDPDFHRAVSDCISGLTVNTKARLDIK